VCATVTIRIRAAEAVRPINNVGAVIFSVCADNLSVEVGVGKTFGLMLKMQSLHVCQMENKKRIFLFLDEVRPVSFKSLVSSWWSSFAVALSAVDWPASVWLEWNFTFLSAVRAGCLVHFFVIHTLFSTPVYDLCAKNVFCTPCIFRRQRLNLSIQTPNFSISLA